MNSHHFDYIIAGAGLAGLSLAHALIHSRLHKKRVLIVDQHLEPADDKTWSFWHAHEPPFANLIYKSWSQVSVGFGDEQLLQPIEKYTYHSIKSSRFTAAILAELQAHPSIKLLEAEIESLNGTETNATLLSGGGTYTADYIFQSCLPPPALLNDEAHYPLIQHFLGCEIETPTDAFDPSSITLMDFDLTFTDGIAFVYVLPQSRTKAIVEYTIFSPTPLPRSFYEEKLAIYLHNKYNFRPLDYTLLRTEYGEIPMQDRPYAPWYAPRVLNMGTVGGLTKPSTGYTFSRIQQHTRAIVKQLQEKGTPALPYRSSFRYRSYDLWLLQIIHDHPEQALTIFKQLFFNNSMDQVFQFLSEENTILEDFRTMSKVAYQPFLKAIWKTRKRLQEL